MPGRRRSDQLRDAIRNATIDILREDGYITLSIEGVAQRAGVGKSTIYRWWTSKADLVLDTVASRITIPPVRPTGDIRTDLRAIIQTITDALLKTPLGNILLAMSADTGNDSAVGERLREFLRPRGEAMRAILRDAADRGDLPADVDEVMIFDICAGAVLYRSHVAHRSGVDLVDQLTSLLLDGRLPRSSP